VRGDGAEAAAEEREGAAEMEGVAVLEEETVPE
jgi:hypothetical protein